MTNQQLFIQLSRAIGDLMALSSEISDRDRLQKIAERLDILMDALQKVLEVR